jgi:hypothetical protein
VSRSGSCEAVGRSAAASRGLAAQGGPAGSFSTGCESWKGTNCGRGASRCGRPALMACEAERLTMRDIAGTQPELPDPNAVVPNKVLFLMHTSREAGTQLRLTYGR